MKSNGVICANSVVFAGMRTRPVRTAGGGVVVVVVGGGGAGIVVRVMRARGRTRRREGGEGWRRDGGHGDELG